MGRKIIWFAIDLLLAATIVLVVWIVNYKIPQKGTKAEWNQQEIDNVLQNKKQDWHDKFADKFTDQVVATDNSYTSPNVSIQLSFHQYDTGILDHSSAGRHEKYGTSISYVLADIYVANISCFQTAFAEDIYGVGHTEKLTRMSKRMSAILSVNGDSYSNDRHKNNGTIIRNGITYRHEQSDAETCVLNSDGTMQIYNPGKWIGSS